MTVESVAATQGTSLWHLKHMAPALYLALEFLEPFLKDILALALLFPLVHLFSELLLLVSYELLSQAGFVSLELSQAITRNNEVHVSCTKHTHTHTLTLVSSHPRRPDLCSPES